MPSRSPNHYGTGRRFEHKVIGHLSENGYEPMRAAGSKGGTKADIAAFKPGQLLLIQCKASGTLPPDEWDRLVEVASWVGAIAILAANGPRGRGIAYTRLLAPKRRGCRNQPCEPFHLDLVQEQL